MKIMKNEKAVSPVIGVILMVVITVIIAAVLAVFAFGVGTPAKAPQVNLKFSAIDNGTDTALTINHEGGDALLLKNEKMTVTMATNGTDAIYNATPVEPVALDFGISSSRWSNSTNVNTLAPGQSIYGTLYYPMTHAGAIIDVKIVDGPTGQLISNARVVVQ